MIHYAVNRDAVLLRPGRQREAARRTSPTASRRSRATRRRSRSSSRRASSSPRRSTARSRPRTSSTASSAPSARTCPRRYATRLLQGHRRRADQARPRSRTSRASRRPTTRRSSSSSRGRARRSSRRRWPCRSRRRCRRSTPSKFDAKTPSTYDQYVAFTGPYMYKNDSSGKLVGRKPGTQHRARAQPQLGSRRPTTARPTWTRSRSRRATTTRSPRRGGSSRARPSSRATARRRRRSSSRRSRATRTRSPSSPAAATASIVDELDDQAVRQPQRPQGGRGRLRPHGAAAHARRHGGRRPGDALPAADFPGFDEAGGAKGTGADFLANPSGDMALAKKYMLAAKKQDPSLPIDANGMWTGSNQLLMVASNADPGKKTGRGRAGPVREARLQDQVPHRPAGHALHEVLQRPQGAEDRDLPERRVRSRTSTTRSRCWTPCSTARTSCPQNNSNWTQLNDPAINDAMAKAALLPAGPERNKAWGKIDDMVTAQAPGDPVPVGQDPHGRGVRRPRRGQPVLHELGSRLHLAEVAPGARSACTANRAPSRSPPPRGGARSRHGRMAAHGPRPALPRGLELLGRGRLPRRPAEQAGAGRRRALRGGGRGPRRRARDHRRDRRAVPGHAGGDPLGGRRDRRRHRAGLLLPGAGHRDDEHRGADQRHRGRAPGRGRDRDRRPACRPSSPSGWR